MSDILERAKAINLKRYQQAITGRDAMAAVDLLPELIAECEKWRKIAIEERARVLALEHVLSLMLPVQSIRPALETAADHMPAFRPRAEKELMAIEQQAKEIKRLQATLAGRELTISEFQDCATKQAARIAELEDLMITEKDGIFQRQKARIAELEAEAQSLHDRKEEFAGHLTAANQKIDRLEGWLQSHQS